MAAIAATMQSVWEHYIGYTDDYRIAPIFRGTTATAKESLHVPGSLVQGNCSPIRDSCIPASCLGTRDTIPMNHHLSQLNAERFGCHSSQINTDPSFMCQRRYRVCATCLRGGTIHSMSRGSYVASGRYYQKFASLIFAVRDQSAKTAKIMRLENLALYGI